VDFVEWLTKPMFVGDKSLMPHVQSKLKWLREGPRPKDRLGPETETDVSAGTDEANCQRLTPHDIGSGELAELEELATRLSKLKWPDAVLPPDGKRPSQSVKTIVRHSKVIKKALGRWEAATDEKRDELRLELKLSLVPINSSQARLIDICRDPALIEWRERVEADKQLVSRFRVLLEAPANTHSEQLHAVELEPIDEACLKCLHAVGRCMQDDPSLNMGLRPLQVFCASYMAVKGQTAAGERIPRERYAVVAHPRFPAWRDQAVQCILEHCQDAPTLQWMTEPNVVRNLVRVVGWAMMFEHGRNRPAVLSYYKRWLHAALRDPGRMSVEAWASGLHKAWFAMEDRESFRPPPPFEEFWKAEGGELEVPGDGEPIDALIRDWPLLPELRIDGDAFERKSAGVVPTSTSSRWLVMQAIPAEWIRPLHSLADKLREVWAAKWTVALVSKLGYFAVLPPDQRNEPRLDGAKALSAAMSERIAQMGRLRALNGADLKSFAVRVEEAINVHSRTDKYRSYVQGQGREGKWWMYGQRYADEVKKWAETLGVDGDSLELALTLYCGRVHTDAKQMHMQSRMMQYMARLSVDDDSGLFKSIWATWVAPRDVRGAEALGAGA
jgi:hypothetical protein